MKYIDLINNNKDIENVIRTLIIHHSQLNSSEIFLNINKEIDFDLNLFNDDLKKYQNGEPLAYILGYSYFLDLKINLKQGIFIPRPETEMLTSELILEIDSYFDKNDILIGDICSGSGAIALALNHHIKAKTYGLEISDLALNFAKLNNKENNCDVEFIKSDVDKYLIDNSIKLDILASTPPYIKPNTKLDSRVLNYEPHNALFDDDNDGMGFYRKILKNHHQTTKNKALIAFEFGFDQKEDMKKLVQKYLPNCKYNFIYDYQGHPRGVIIFKDKK